MSLIDITWRRKMALVAVCYAAVIGLGVLAIVLRYFEEMRNPNDFNGGMAAAGDWMLELMIGMALLVPTFLLALVVREREAASLMFAKVLFAFSLTALLSMALDAIPVISQTNNLVGTLCMYRLLASPVVLAGMGTSRLLARYRPAKRLISYALVCEAIPLAAFVVALFWR